MSAHATSAIEASGLEVQALPSDRAAGSGQRAQAVARPPGARANSMLRQTAAIRAKR
jgi:hypothetical protein